MSKVEVCAVSDPRLSFAVNIGVKGCGVYFILGFLVPTFHCSKIHGKKMIKISLYPLEKSQLWPKLESNRMKGISRPVIYFIPLM